MTEGALADALLLDILARIEAAGLDGPARRAALLALSRKLAAEAGTPQALPDHAPELWETRGDRSEKPPAFIMRVYAPWLGTGFTQADLKARDPKLYMALHNWLRTNPLPAELDLPTKRERNDAELAAHGLDPASLADVKATTRLASAARRRAIEKKQ